MCVYVCSSGPMHLGRALPIPFPRHIRVHHMRMHTRPPALLRRTRSASQPSAAPRHSSAPHLLLAHQPLLTSPGASLPRALCREVKYAEDAEGNLEVTSLVLGESNRTWEVQADAYVAALDVPGAQRLIPAPWRRLPLFDNIYKLVGVPVITVQLR